MNQIENHLPTPGYKLFRCDSCEYQWKQKSDNCRLVSGRYCPRCTDYQYSMGYEKDFELINDSIKKSDVGVNYD